MIQDKNLNNVKITLQIKDKERKDWKQYALDNDITMTEAIRRAMQKLLAKGDTK